MQDDSTFQPEEFSALDGATPAFADDDPEMEAADVPVVIEVIELDPRVAEMRDALQTLRDTEVSHALRELRQLFPHIPFPKRVRALMAVRHGAMAG
jgi:hypothetical protein